MMVPAVCLEFKEARTVPGPRSSYCPACCFSNLQDVVSIHRLCRNSICPGPFRYRRSRENVPHGCVGPIEVVLAHKNDRQLPDGSEVEALMKLTFVARAIAEENPDDLLARSLGICLPPCDCSRCGRQASGSRKPPPPLLPDRCTNG